MYYLLKTEPSTYSFADLQKEKQTIWDGVSNPQAVRNLREMQKGAKLIIYHTGDEKRTVGTATVVGVDAADVKTPKVTIKVGSELKRSFTLAELKGKKEFANSLLARNSRLSVVPLTEEQYAIITGD